MKSLSYNLGFRNRCKHANLILSKTEIHKESVPVNHRTKAILFTDVAVDDFKFKNDTFEKQTTIVRYIVVSKLDSWRGFDILIEAFAKAVKNNDNIELQIVGKGIDLNRLRNLIQNLKMANHIKMIGAVTMERYKQLMKETDVVVNPCLKEGAVTTAFDSMALGKPLICIDTTGYTRYFSKEYAIVIPKQNRENTILDLKESILKLTDPIERDKLGIQAQTMGAKFTWENKGKEIYKAIIKAYVVQKS